MSISPPEDHGPRYVLDRWRELCDGSGPWWTRATEVGVRLRLEELRDLARANQEGGVRPATIRKLIDEAVGLLEEDGYPSQRFPAVAEAAKRLAHSPASAFVTDGHGPSAAVACLDHLDRPDYVRGLVPFISDVAGSIGHGQDDFRRLDALVCQLDAELVHDGHSRGWRRAVLEEIAARFEDSGSLEQSIGEALEANHHGKRREFQVLVPLSGLVPTGADTSRLHGIELEPAINLVKEWDPDGIDQLLAHLTAGDAAASLSLVASDAEAAARMADDELREAIGTWRLLDRSIVDPEHALAHDPLTDTVHLLRLPSEPLEVRPANLERWQATSGSPMGEALAQLAEARTAPPSTAFVDLWMAAEALYGGAVGDGGWRAGEVMAGLAQFVYVRDLLAWFARRAARAGFDSPPETGEAGWLAQQLVERAPDVERALSSAGDALAWHRFKVMMRWDGGWGLRNDLDRLSLRLTSVCDRAYLIRNFAVHRAQTRGRTLQVVLPAFAGLVAAAISHSLEADDGHVLVDALSAGIQARATAYDFAAQRSEAPGGLSPMIGSGA